MTRSVDRPLPMRPHDLASPAPMATAAPNQPASPASRSPDEAPVPVDLAWLRARLPDNRYWTLGAPTDDPAILANRAEAARRENELYGTILSGTGSEDDIDRYFEERRRLLTDYSEVARVALAEGGDQLSEHDRGLFELALKMDQERLDALPRERDDAFARKRLQDERRAAWRSNR